MFFFQHNKNAKFLKKFNIAYPAEIEALVDTIVVIAINEKYAGYITIADEIKEDAKQAIDDLHKLNIKTVMLSGDKQSVVDKVSKVLGIDNAYGDLLPEGKVEKVQTLKNEKRIIAFVGDGVNDAPALAQADIGIAVGSGSDIAAETAGIILVNSNPKDIVNLILFGKATYRKMVQNLMWATGYNVIALPLAAGVLYNYGILLSPAAGAALMSVSTIVVAINASMLKIKQ